MSPGRRALRLPTPLHLVRRRETSWHSDLSVKVHACCEPRSFRASEGDDSQKGKGSKFLKNPGRTSQDLNMESCSQIPAAAWQQLEGAHWPKLTTVNFEKCFGDNFKGADGVAGLLRALARCPELEALGMKHCSRIPAAAWQQLEGATWSKLTYVEFEGCFGENSKGADGVAGLLTALARCPGLKDASSLSLQ
ncbi:unnamed protein product [Symbiodinium necroappetens]|uniref:Uncharacterized protein n=1 Tax=Symbiodinium necroappetens TaxID=1628268 RepID=A0A813C5H0_9DINO|nr:unnamed protein product [Symbiodinium necroappetens]